MEDTDKYEGRVKSAVERTVGIAALTIDEPLAAVVDAFNKEVVKANRKDARTEKFGNDLDACEINIRDLK